MTRWLAALAVIPIGVAACGSETGPSAVEPVGSAPTTTIEEIELSDPPERTLVDLVPTAELLGPEWSVMGPFLDEREPSENPTDCAVFDVVFELGNHGSASVELSVNGTRATHTVRAVGSAERARTFVDRFADLSGVCPEMDLGDGRRTTVEAIPGLGGAAHRILPDDLTIVLLAEGEHVVAIEGAALSPDDLEVLVEVSVLLLD